MSRIKKQIISDLEVVVASLFTEKIPVAVAVSSNPTHGDYTTNLALTLFAKPNIKKQGIYKNPVTLAGKIREKYVSLYNNDMPLDIERVEILAPGFINFFLSKDFLVKNMYQVLEKKQTSVVGQLQNRKVMVEFTDPNPFKEFHIGHLYSNVVGEAISRLLESQGAEVRRVNYQGDVGMHVAKSLWGLQKIMRENQKTLEDLEKEPLDKRAAILGRAYAMGAKLFEQDEAVKKEITLLNAKIFQESAEIKELYNKGRQWSLAYFESIYQRLGTKFDIYYFESQVGKIGLDLVYEYLKKGIFEESEGAVIFPGEKYGLHNRVFINSQGLPTYEAKELGLAPFKFKDFPYDLSIIITGNEINEYFKVLLTALNTINPDLALRTKHLSHGMVVLPQGKMSSRSGNVLLGEWLLDEAKSRIVQAYKDMDEKTADQVAIGAIKYALLKSGIGRDIRFSFEESISLEGNSGPYIQYTYVRTQSVLRKALGEDEKEIRSQESKQEEAKNLQDDELIVLRTLAHFREVIEDATRTYAPNLVATYLFELAQQFNMFYQKYPILQSKEKHVRLVLTKAVGSVLLRGLWVLGIEAPQRM